MIYIVYAKSVIGGLILGRAGGQVLLDHQRYLKDDRVLKFAQIETGQLLDLLKTVDQRVAVYEQLAGGLGNVQVVLKELLDGEQGLLIEAVDRAALKDLFEEHVAEVGGQLIDQSGDTEVVVADDGALGVEHLADLEGYHRFLEGMRQILDAGDGGAHADDAVGVELGGEGVDDGAGKLLQVLGRDTGLDLLDQCDIGLIDVDDKILGLVGEKILHDVISGDVGLGGDLDEHDHAADVAVEAQFTRLQIDVAGQDVVEDDVLDEVAAVILLIIILLDGRQRNRQELRVLLRDLIASLYKYGILGSGGRTERLVCMSVDDKRYGSRKGVGSDAFIDLADTTQLRARDDNRSLVHNSDGSVDGVLHLMNNSLK